MHPTTLKIKSVNSIVDNGLVAVPCGTCITCRLGYLSDIQLKNMLQAEDQLFRPQFWGFSYDPLYYNPKPDYKQIQDALQRARNILYYKNYPLDIKYFTVCEWSETGRLHWHTIVYDFPFDLSIEQRQNIWPWGYLHIQKPINFQKAVRYHTKYILKDYYEDLPYKPIAKWSTRPLLGERALYKICDYNILNNQVPSEIGALFPFKGKKYFAGKTLRKKQRDYYIKHGFDVKEHSVLMSELRHHSLLAFPDSVAYAARKEKNRRLQSKTDDKAHYFTQPVRCSSLLKPRDGLKDY